MKTDTYCSQCGQKDTCRQAYEKLGASQGPNVTWEVTRAFLLPLAVFLISLAAGQQLLRDLLAGKALILASFAASLCVTAAFIWVMQWIRIRFDKRHSR